MHTGFEQDRLGDQLALGGGANGRDILVAQGEAKTPWLDASSTRSSEEQLGSALRRFLPPPGSGSFRLGPVVSGELPAPFDVVGVLQRILGLVSPAEPRPSSRISRIIEFASRHAAGAVSTSARPESGSVVRTARRIGPCSVSSAASCVRGGTSRDEARHCRSRPARSHDQAAGRLRADQLRRNPHSREGSEGRAQDLVPRHEPVERRSQVRLGHLIGDEHDRLGHRSGAGEQEQLLLLRRKQEQLLLLRRRMEPRQILGSVRHLVSRHALRHALPLRSRLFGIVGQARLLAPTALSPTPPFPTYKPGERAVQPWSRRFPQIALITTRARSSTPTARDQRTSRNFASGGQALSGGSLPFCQLVESVRDTPAGASAGADGKRCLHQQRWHVCPPLRQRLDVPAPPTPRGRRRSAQRNRPRTERETLDAARSTRCRLSGGRRRSGRRARGNGAQGGGWLLGRWFRRGLERQRHLARTTETPVLEGPSIVAQGE